MKNNNPIISVIMPNYNWWKYIWEAIKSILDQSFNDFEFIIIDDWSRDNSLEIINKYKEKDYRIILIKNKKNSGICISLNKWINISKWKYIARMDSDDISIKSRLEKQINLLEKNKLIWVCWSNVININSIWKEISKTIFPKSDRLLKKIIWFRNPFKHSSTMIRKICFEQSWLYDDKYRLVEDLDLWIRIGQKYKFYNLSEFLVKYRIHWNNAILKKQKIMILKTLKVRRKAIKLWYKISFKWIIYYVWTFLMLFLPSKFVLYIFTNLIYKF